MGVGAVLRPSRWGGSLSASASRPAPTQWAATDDLSRTSRQGGSSRSIGRFSTTVSPATVRRRLQGEAAPEQHRHQQPEQPDDHQDDLHRVEVEPRAGVDVHGKVKIAPRTNRKRLKPIPTASPPRHCRAAVRAAIGRRCRSLGNAAGCPAVTTKHPPQRVGDAPAAGGPRFGGSTSVVPPSRRRTTVTAERLRLIWPRWVTLDCASQTTSVAWSFSYSTGVRQPRALWRRRTLHRVTSPSHHLTTPRAVSGRRRAGLSIWLQG
jgi:hypothetical protein